MLPGPVQTVPRSEAFALLTVLQQVGHGSQIEFITDNKSVKLTYDKGSGAVHLSKNDDIFSQIFTFVVGAVARRTLKVALTLFSSVSFEIAEM